MGTSNNTVDVAAYLTSHEIARYLGVSASAVLSWIDKGWLLAHRTPGGHRRVDRSELRRFLGERGMPVPRELGAFSKILVIDDDRTFLRAVRRSLEQCRREWTIVLAEGGIDGLLKVGTFLPDAVLLDAFMPNMDGVEVCKRIQQTEATRHIRVIALTGCGSPELSRSFLDAGALACLQKPLDCERLLELLGEGQPASASRVGPGGPLEVLPDELTLADRDLA